MDVENIVQRYYGRLFALPNLARLLIYNYLLAIFIALVTSMIKGLDIFTIIIKYVYAATIYVILIYLGVGLFNEVVGFRRSVGIALFNQLFLMITDMLIPNRYLGYTYLLSAGFLFIVSSSVTNSLLRIVVTSVIPPLITFYVINLGHPLPSYAIILYLLNFALGVIYVSLANILGSKYYMKPLKLLRGFLNAWLANDPKVLEDALSTSPKYDDVKVTLINMMHEDGGHNVVLTFPQIHYGPFKNVGSSAFIHILESLCPENLKVFSFHTLGSHERNVASSKITKELALEITKSLMSTSWVYTHPYKPFRVRHKGWSFFVLPFDKVKLIFIHNEDVGNDDLPYKIMDLVSSKVSVGRSIVLIDSHSAKGPKEVKVSDIVEGINKVLEFEVSDVCDEFMVGYGESKVKGTCRGLCKDLVKALVIKCNSSTYALIYIYGNNMDLSYRRELIAKLKGLHSFSDVEVVTPDDHSCAATTRDTPYSIVIRYPPLTKAIEESVRIALSNLRRSKVLFKEVLIKNIPLMGDYVWDLIKGLEIIGEKLIRLLFITIALFDLCPLLSTYLILH